MRENKSHLFGREVLRSIENGEGAAFIRDLVKHNTLKLLIPELAPCVGFEGGSHHNETVLEHLILALEWAEKENYPLAVKLAALLHDCGKPVSFKQSGNEISFHGHELTGATIAYNLLTRWDYPKELVEEVVKLIRYHMYKFDEVTRDKALKHWLFKLGPSWKNIVYLRACDRRGNLKKKDRPTFTPSMLELISRCDTLIEQTPVFREDLDIPDGLIEKLPENEQDGVYINLLWIIKNNPERNNPIWLSEYVKRVYFHET